MRRSGLILISALVAIALPAVSHAAVAVFQDPTNVGTPGAPAATIPIGGGPVSLNLFYRNDSGTTASPSNPCLSGTGHEVCGWDIHVLTSAPGVVLSNFIPNPGSDTVWAISGNIWRGNGGVPTSGELGVRRIGTLVVSATTAGNVIVSGNLYVTAALAAANVTTGNTLATAVAGGDTDGDTVLDPTDNCVTVANTNQADGDGDLVGDLCDNCTGVSNPRVSAAFLAVNSWVTMTGGQRDDDHDGFGTKCDAKFVGLPTSAVGALDLNQFRASNGKNRDVDTCGTAGNRPCAIFDLDENTTTANAIGALDLNRFRALNGLVPGPKCTACTGTGSVPLPCTAGASGNCN